MVLLLLILICCAAGSRLLVERLLPHAHVADRLVAFLLIAFVLFLGVPIQSGLLFNDVRLGRILIIQIAVAGVIGAVCVVRCGKRGERVLARSITREWLDCVRAATWPARLSWLAAIACVFVAMLPGWFLPPRFVDAADYHILQPLQWLEHNTFEFNLRRSWDMAPGWWWGETYPNLKALWIVQWVQARHSFNGAGMIQGAMAAVWLAALWALGRRLQLAGWAMGAAALAVISMPDVILQCTEIYADVHAAAAMALVVWSLVGLADRDESPRSWIWLSGFALGHLAAVKASTIMATGLLGVAALTLAWKRGAHRGERARLLAGMAAVAAMFGVALAGAWLLRNMVVYDNPLYPIKVGPFPGFVDKGLNLSGVAEENRNPWFFFARSPFESLGVTHLGNRLGGLGPASTGLMAPALVAVALWAIRQRDRRWGLHAVLLALMVAGIPDLWWPRYQLCLVTTGALALAWLLAESRVFARTILLLLLGVAVVWNGIRSVPAVLGWPNPPLYATYPFVTGDTVPVALRQPPDVYTGRDYVREHLMSDPSNWVAYNAYIDTPYWFAKPGEARRTVAMPRIDGELSPVGWTALLRHSRATHIIAEDWRDQAALASRPDWFRRVWRDEPWPVEHPWNRENGLPIEVWEIIR